MAPFPTAQDRQVANRKGQWNVLDDKCREIREDSGTLDVPQLCKAV